MKQVITDIARGEADLDTLKAGASLIPMAKITKVPKVVKAIGNVGKTGLKKGKEGDKTDWKRFTQEDQLKPDKNKGNQSKTGSKGSTTTSKPNQEETSKSSQVKQTKAKNKEGSKAGKLFKNQSLLEEHYGKHGQEIADVLREPNYSINKYLDDANYIIDNGTYVPELNGYVSFMRGKKYGFVGLDRTTEDITTFHIKNVSELIKKAPSLGFER